MKNILLDTGPLVAFLSRQDRYHEWATAQFATMAPPLRTCEAVLTEACFLLRRHAEGSHGVIEFLRRGLIAIDFSLGQEAAFVEELLTRYANVPMSLADACLVRMAEHTAGSTVMTLDTDFHIYRIHGRRIVPTLMPPP